MTFVRIHAFKILTAAAILDLGFVQNWHGAPGDFLTPVDPVKLFFLIPSEKLFG